MMMEFLRIWVKDIFIIVVGLYFIEIVLPEGSMRKYIKFIFSVMILGVVISPLVNLGSIGEQLESEVVAAAGDMRESVYTAADLEEVQWIQMEQVYKTKLKTQVRGILSEALPGVEIQSVEAELAEHVGEKDFGKVNKIVIKTSESEYVSSIKQYVSLGLGIEKDKISVDVLTEEQSETQPQQKEAQLQKEAENRSDGAENRSNGSEAQTTGPAAGKDERK